MSNWAESLKTLNLAKAIYEKLGSTLNEEEAASYQGCKTTIPKKFKIFVFKIFVLKFFVLKIFVLKILNQYHQTQNYQTHKFWRKFA